MTHGNKHSKKSFRFQNVYDSSVNFVANNPILLAGELGVEADTSLMKVGDGLNRWLDLSYTRVDVLSTGDIPESGDPTLLYFTQDERDKLALIADAATANQTDSYLTSRVNHTGTLDVSLITGLHLVATSGDYDDLSNIPVPFDGDYYSLTSLPTLSAVATTGSWYHIDNRPFIPTALADLIEDSTHHTVTSVQIQQWNALVEGISPTILGELLDVDTAGATDAQALVYNLSLNQWEPGTVADTAPSDLTDLADVSTVGATNLQALSYILATDSWEPRTITGSGGTAVVWEFDRQDQAGDYVGYTNTNGEWRIKKYVGVMPTVVRTYADLTNNGTYATLDLAWVDRATLNYA